MALEDERRARKAAEAKIASLEVDVADLKRQRSSVAIFSINSWLGAGHAYA